jgi:phosphoglycolate phosphatase-like HAD superfamily hydrolase
VPDHYWYGHGVRPLLVLWDVDYTLVTTDGVGKYLYEVVLAELYGLDLPSPLTSMAGRTDSSIGLEVLTAAGVPEPQDELSRFQDLLSARAPELDDMVREHGRVLPGAEAAIAALAGLAGRDGRQPVVQSLLTGNIPALARVKLGALGLTEHLDLSIGAYGDVSQFRADLVPVARQYAARRYSADFSGTATVLIGDTPNDIEAATTAGARSVGVATGSFTMQQLIDAGADVVLADLTDADLLVAAVLEADTVGLGTPVSRDTPPGLGMAAGRGTPSEPG